MMFQWPLTAGGGNCRVDTKLIVAGPERRLSNNNSHPLSALVKVISVVGWLLMLVVRMSVWKVRVVAVLVVVVAGGETVRTLQPD